MNEVATEAGTAGLRKALLAVEWVFEDGIFYCPWCDGRHPDWPAGHAGARRCEDHADDCPRQVALYGESWWETQPTGGGDE